MAQPPVRLRRARLLGRPPGSRRDAGDCGSYRQAALEGFATTAIPFCSEAMRSELGL